MFLYYAVIRDDYCGSSKVRLIGKYSMQELCGFCLVKITDII